MILNIGESIRQRRMDLGMSQEELAIAVGYKSRSSINKIELSRSLPLKKLEVIAKALGCTPTDLMRIEETKPPVKEIDDTPRGYAPVVSYHEELNRNEFELLDLYRHLDRWGKNTLMRLARSERKRCEQMDYKDFKENKYRG